MLVFYIEEKPCIKKDQGWKPIHWKCKAKENMSRQPKEKTKANNQQKLRKKKRSANRTQGYEMTINITKKT